MKISLFNNKSARRLPLLLAVAGSAFFFSCNKGVPNLLDGNSDYGKDTSNVALKTPKVLYVIIDGARGEAIRDIIPANLSIISKNSVYTFNSLDNASGINAVGWADMLTGVDSSKHEVKSADFDNNQLSTYPSLFTRLKSVNPDGRTAAFVRSQTMNDYLLTDATVHQVLPSDDAAIAAAVNEINTGDPSLVMVELNNVDSIGKQYSYETNNFVYAQAIEDADSRVGTLINSLQNRASYSNENWLVVIASDKGGPLPYTPGTDTSLYSNPKGNGFIFFYNPRFKLAFSAKPSMVPYIGSAPIYTGSSYAAKAPATTTTDYDITPTNEMTISFKLKVLQYGSLNPGIVLKTGSSANSYNGWWFCHNGSNGSIRFVVRGSGGTHSGTNNTITSTTGYQAVNEWHSYTGKVYMSAGKRYMQLYIDGVASTASPIDITNLDASAIHSGVNSPLSIGIPGSYQSGTTKEMVTDLRIYDMALPDDYIAETACKRGDEMVNDPYADHLIGFWPGDDGIGTTGISDLSGKGNNLTFVSPPSSIWNSFSDLSNNICPNPNETYLNLTPKGVDIPFQIYQWLEVSVPSSWGLEGRAWPADFKDLKQN